MRVIVKACGHTLDMEFGKDEPTEPIEPAERDADLRSETERAAGWDHDTRVPIGFGGPS